MGFKLHSLLLRVTSILIVAGFAPTGAFFVGVPLAATSQQNAFSLPTRTGGAARTRHVWQVPNELLWFFAGFMYFVVAAADMLRVV